MSDYTTHREIVILQCGQYNNIILSRYEEISRLQAMCHNIIIITYGVKLGRGVRLYM